MERTRRPRTFPKASSPPPTAHRWLLLEEVAQIARVSYPTAYDWVFTGKLKSTRPGRRRLVRSDWLDAFLNEEPARAAR